MERLIDDCIIMDYGRILVQTPVNDLLSRIRRYSATVSPDYTPIQDERFYNPSIIRDRFETFSMLPEQEALAALRGSGLDSGRIEVERVNLEDAFIGLTGKY